MVTIAQLKTFLVKVIFKRVEALHIFLAFKPTTRICRTRANGIKSQILQRQVTWKELKLPWGINKCNI